jgi:hypothetical protein
MKRTLINLLAISSLYSTNLLSAEDVSIKGVSSESLNSFYSGIAITLELHGKRNYWKNHDLSQEQLLLLNATNVLRPQTTLINVKDYGLYKKAVVLTSKSLSTQDGMGLFKEVCFRVGFELTPSEVRNSVNSKMEGEFEEAHLDYLIMAVRETLGKKYPC